MEIDHPIFLKSIQYIKSRVTCEGLEDIQQEILLRMIHTSGDFAIQKDLFFSIDACKKGLKALCQGAPILTDSRMALEAIKPMAARTKVRNSVHCVLDWAPLSVETDLTRTAFGMQKAWSELSELFVLDQSPLVVIGSSPTALMGLLKTIANTNKIPTLIIGMPVGFINVIESKNMLLSNPSSYITLKGTKGGAALASSVVNALLRATI